MKLYIHRYPQTERSIKFSQSPVRRGATSREKLPWAALVGAGAGASGKEAEEVQSWALNMVNIAVLGQSVSVSHVSVSLSHLQPISTLSSYIERLIILYKTELVEIKLGPAVRVFANGPGDLGSIPGRVIPKTLKMVLDTTLLNTQHYKVRFKGKVEQSWEWSSALPYTLV